MSNSNALYSLNGVPLFTYGMIGITTFVLACVTLMDDSNKSFAKDEGYEKTVAESSSVMNVEPSEPAEPVEQKEETEEQKEEPVEQKEEPVEQKEETEEQKEEQVEQKGETEEIPLPANPPSATPETSSQTKPTGGKRKNRKTKHNKRQNTYTRRR